MQTGWIITSCLELRPKKSTSTSSSSLPLQLLEDMEFSPLFILQSSPSSSDELHSLYAEKRSDNDQSQMLLAFAFIDNNNQ